MSKAVPSRRPTDLREESDASTASRQGGTFGREEDGDLEEISHTNEELDHNTSTQENAYPEEEEADPYDNEDDVGPADETNSDSDDSDNHVRKVKKTAPEDITAGDLMKLTMLAFKEERISALPHHTHRSRGAGGERDDDEGHLSSTTGQQQQQRSGYFATVGSPNGSSKSSNQHHSSATNVQASRVGGAHALNYTAGGLKVPSFGGAHSSKVARSISLTGNALGGLVSAVSRNSTASRFMQANQLVADVMHTTNNAHQSGRPNNAFGKPPAAATTSASGAPLSPPAMLDSNYAHALKTKKVDYLLYNNPMVSGSGSGIGGVIGQQQGSQTSSAHLTPALLSPNGRRPNGATSPSPQTLSASAAVTPSNSMARRAPSQQLQASAGRPPLSSGAVTPTSGAFPLSSSTQPLGITSAVAGPKNFVSTFVPSSMPLYPAPFEDINNLSVPGPNRSGVDRFNRHHSVAGLTLHSAAAATALNKSKGGRTSWFSGPSANSNNSSQGPATLPIDPIGHSVVASKCDPGFVYRLPSTLAEENAKRAIVAAKAKKVMRAAMAIGGAAALFEGGKRGAAAADAVVTPLVAASVVPSPQSPASPATNGAKPPTSKDAKDAAKGSPTKTSGARDSVVAPLSPAALTIPTHASPNTAAASPIVGPKITDIAHPALPPTIHGKADTTITLFSSVFSRESEMARAVDTAPLSSRAGNGGGKHFPHNNFAALIGTVTNPASPAASPSSPAAKDNRASVLMVPSEQASPIKTAQPSPLTAQPATTIAYPKATVGQQPPTLGAVTRPSSSSPATRALLPQGANATAGALHSTASNTGNAMLHTDASHMAMLLQAAMAGAMTSMAAEDENHTVLDDAPYIDTLRDTLFPALALALEKLLVDGKAMQIELERNRMVKGIPDPVAAALKAVRPKLAAPSDSTTASRLASNARKSASPSANATNLNSSATLNLNPNQMQSSTGDDPLNSTGNGILVNSAQQTPRPAAPKGVFLDEGSAADSRPLTATEAGGATPNNTNDTNDNRNSPLPAPTASVSRTTTANKKANHSNLAPPSVGKHRPKSGQGKRREGDDSHASGDEDHNPANDEMGSIGPHMQPGHHDVPDSSFIEQLGGTATNVMSVSNSARATPLGPEANNSNNTTATIVPPAAASPSSGNTRPIGRSNSVIGGIGGSSRKRVSSASCRNNKDEASVSIQDPADPTNPTSSSPPSSGSLPQPNTSPGLPQYGVPGNSRRAPHDSAAQKKALAAAAASFFNSKKTFPAGPIESFLKFRDPLDLVDPLVIAERANANVYRSSAVSVTASNKNGSSSPHSPQRRTSGQTGGIMGITLPGMPPQPSAATVAAIAASQKPVSAAAAIRFFATELKRIGQEQKATAERAAMAAAVSAAGEPATIINSPGQEGLFASKLSSQ